MITPPPVPAAAIAIATVLAIGGNGGAYADTPDHVTSNLQVQIPSSLFKAGGYEHREALFGTPPYGGSINQPLYYVDGDLCDPTVDPTKGYPSRGKDDKGKQLPWPSPFILMMDRGGCSFVQKVRNAQHAGAAGVIIADNICLCTDTDCLKHYRDAQTAANPDSPPESIPCEQNEPIMADDGSGGDIDIPAFLIMKHDADILKDEMKGNDRKVQVQMQWTLPAPDDRVEYELWTTPSEHVSQEFQENWKDVARVFKEHIYFTPREYVYDGKRFDCDLEPNREVCDSLCTNGWRYCAMDPDYNINKGTSGADLVVESLRRICIWKHYGAEDGIGIKYWDYISEFFARCDNADFFSNEKCVADALKRAKLDAGIVERCMRDSGGTNAKSPNTFLDLEIAAQARRGVVILPTIYVNSVALRGALTSNTLIGAICAGFVGGTAPKVCGECSGCADKARCVTNGGVCEGGPRTVADGVTSETEATAVKDYPSTTSVSLFDSYFEKLKDVADQCIDSKIMNGDDIIMNALEKFNNSCTDTQTSKFESALLHYKDCTNTNLADFIETLWDASLGMTLTCASYFYKHGPALLVEVTAGNISEMPFREHMPPECVDSLLGRNAFGDFFREHIIHPKKNAKCLVNLGLKVPDCTLRRWPVPIPGSVLKSFSCISNKIQQELDLCKAEVEALKCLPDVSYFLELSDDEQDAECQRLARTCTIDQLNAGKAPSMIMFLPPPLSAQPLPDICDDDLSLHASIRLNAYQMVCFSEEDRNIWTSGERGTANVPLTDVVQKVKAAQKSSEQSSTKDGKFSSSSGFGVFLFGTIAGTVCTVLVGIFKQRSRDSGGMWQEVEMGQGQTLT